eukprot:3873869-Prymnesium_polylepis.2
MVKARTVATVAEQAVPDSLARVVAVQRVAAREGAASVAANVAAGTAAARRTAAAMIEHLGME